MLLRGENEHHGEAIKIPHLAHDEVELQQQWKPRVDLDILWQVGLNRTLP